MTDERFTRRGHEPMGCFGCVVVLTTGAITLGLIIYAISGIFS